MNHMTIVGERIEVFSAKADVHVLPVFGGESFSVDGVLAQLPEGVRKSALRLMKAQEFQGKTGESFTVEASTGSAHAVVVIGMGEEEKATLETVREMVGIAVAATKRVAGRSLAIAMPSAPESDPAHIAEAMVIAAQLADYAFDAYKPKNGAKRIKELTLCIAQGRDVTCCVCVRRWSEGMRLLQERTSLAISSTCRRT